MRNHRRPRTSGLAALGIALVACASTASDPEGSQGMGSSSPRVGDDPSPGRPDASDTETEPPPASDGQEPGTDCALERGIFEPLYTQRTGQCGPLDDANAVSVESNVLIQKFANVDVETETVITGCSVDLVQTVRAKDGVPQKRIEGTLHVASPARLTGEVTLRRYDSNGVAICAGTYDATLTKRTTTIGGAAQ